MMTWDEIVLLVVNIISSILTFLFFIVAFCEEIFGADAVKKVLKKWKIPLSYNQLCVFAFVCLALSVVTSIFLFGDV